MNYCGNFIFSVLKKLCYLKFRSIMASLTVADVFAVYKYIKAACNTKKRKTEIAADFSNLEFLKIYTNRAILWEIGRINRKLIALIYIVWFFIACVLPH